MLWLSGQVRSSSSSCFQSQMPLPTLFTVLCPLQCRTVSFFVFLMFSRELGYTGSSKVFFNTVHSSLRWFSSGSFCTWLPVINSSNDSFFLHTYSTCPSHFNRLSRTPCSEMLVACSVRPHCLSSCLCSWFVKFFSPTDVHRRQALSPYLWS